MSDRRIINIHDGPNGTPPPPQPIVMEDLLNDAQRDWKAGHKQRAFVKVLGGMAMMSVGVAQSMKMAELAMKEVEALKAKLPGIDP